MSREKPTLINKAKLSEKDIEERKRLLIETRAPIVMKTDKGLVLFPTSGARANAWICAWCKETPYQDALYTKAELNNDFDEDLTENEIPLILFLTPPNKPESETIALEFHFKCAEELGILNSLVSGQIGDARARAKLEVTFTERGMLILPDDLIPIEQAFNLCDNC